MKKYFILLVLEVFILVQEAKSECQTNVVGNSPAEIPKVNEETKEEICITCPYLRKYNYNGKCTDCVDDGGSDAKAQDEEKGQCIENQSCEGYLSEQKIYCWNGSCKKNEILKSQGKGDKSYFECVACKGDTPYKSSDGTSCVSKCSNTEIIDQSTNQCIANIQKCSGYISSDGTICSYRCQKSEIPLKREEGQTFIKCQKCPNDKLFVSSDLNKCVAACSQTEIVQEKYNGCLSKDEECNQVNEKQIYNRYQQKCISPGQCPSPSYEEDDVLYSYCVQCQPQEFVEQFISQIDNKPRHHCVEFCREQGNVADIETKQCIPESKCTKQILSYTYNLKVCSKECPAKQYLLIEGGNKSCVDQCPDFVDVASKKCITYNDCKDFILDRSCVQKCPDNLWTEIQEYKNGNELQQQKSCQTQCRDGTFIQTNSEKVCKNTCLKGELEDYENHKCLKSKNECLGYISLNGKECQKQCEYQEYSVIKDNIKFCKFCIGILLNSSSDNTPNQCVTQCPNSYPFVKIYKNSDVTQRECSTKEYCKKYLISSDNKFCSEKCQLPDRLEIENGVEKCVKQCSPQNKYLTNQSSGELQCKQTCDGIISSNNKYCLTSCQDVLEVDLKGVCTKCKQGEYFYDYMDMNQKTEIFICTPETNDKKEIEQRLDVSYQSIEYQQTMDFQFQNLKSVLTILEQNKLMKEYLEKISRRIYSLQKELFRISDSNEIIQKTNKRIFISQSLSKKFDQQFNLSFTLSKLKSDNPGLILPYSNDSGELPKFKPTSILVIISSDNYLCTDSQSPEKCFQNTELTQLLYDEGELYGEDINLAKNTEFNIFYDNIDIKLINQYVCLTTDNGAMSKSINTEILSNGIKCTFKNNVSLFQDSKNMFINQSCPQDKPYTFQGKCYADCASASSVLDPARNVCVSKIEECSLISEDGKQCVAKCSNEQPYLVKLSEKQNGCQKECKKNQITDKQKQKCYNDKNECKQFLVDGVFCQEDCPNKFQFKNESTQYKLCNSSCEFISSEDGDKKYCQSECKQEDTFTTVDQQDKPLQKYCNKCPAQSPFTKILPSKVTACYPKCKDSEITNDDLKKCLTSKEDCTDYLVDEKVCKKECNKDLFRYKNEKTPFKQCNSKCNLQYSYSQDGQNVCDTSCLTHHIIDKEAKTCYNQKTECQKYVSLDGTECNSKCGGESEELQSIESIGNYKQCKICRNIIQEEKDSNQNKVNKCVTKCNSEEMIFRKFDEKQNLLKKCVTKTFCDNKKTSADKLSCSEKCIKPEIEHGNQCVLKCPETYFYSPKDNSCTNECDEYLSSDGLLCVPNCEKIFEAVDESPCKDQKKCKKCKKCSANEYQSIDNSNGSPKSVCKTIQKTDDARDAMMKDLITQLSQKVESVQEVEAAQKAISTYATEVGNKLSDLSKQKTEVDQKAAKKEFQNILDITSQLLSKVDIYVSQVPVTVGNSEMMVKSQVKQPGKKFKTTFTSSQIQKGTQDSLLEEDLDESTKKFAPYILQVSFLKNNHFCSINECKNSPPLFVVTFLNQAKQRVLADGDSQQFKMVHEIPEGQEPSKLWCYTIDQNGRPQYSKGEISDKKINCTFQFGSGLFYDKNCEIDKKGCSPVLNEEESEEDSKDDRLSGGAIAGIVIGVVVFIGIVIFIVLYKLSKRKSQKGPSQAYIVQTQQDNNVIQVYDNKVIDTLNNFDITPKTKK